PGRVQRGPVRGDDGRVRGAGPRAEGAGLRGPVRDQALRGAARAERGDPEEVRMVQRALPALADRADDGPAPREDRGAGSEMEVYGRLQVPLRGRVRHGEGVLAGRAAGAEARARDVRRGPQGE